MAPDTSAPDPTPQAGAPSAPAAGARAPSSGPDRSRTDIAAVGRTLRHHDPSQLLFQLDEIVGHRTYLRHGVHLREGDTVLDVGGNVGVAAVFFASECRVGAVHSFEPVAPIFELLRENTRGFESCVSHNYGLSGSPGEAAITYYPGAAAMSGLYADPQEDEALVRTCLMNRGHSESTADDKLEGRYRPVLLHCELRTLSSVLREHSLDRVDLLKIDVERAELDVLSGIEEGDWPRIRQVAVEVHDMDGRRAMIAEDLLDRGFRVTTEQDPAMSGTDVHMLYATRR